MVKIGVILLIVLAFDIDARIYGRCELARSLKKAGVPRSHISTWVCIAKYESNYNTTKINFKTGDYGIFQISEFYW